MNEKEDLVLSKATSKTTVKNTEHDSKKAPNGMPVYDINEPRVQQHIEDFGTELSFF